METVCGLWNVLINEKYQVDRLVAAFESTLKIGLVRHQILIRGSFRNLAKLKIESLKRVKHLPQVEIVSEEPSLDWKLNHLWLMERGRSSHYIMLQEDHILIGRPEKVINFIQECIERRIQYAPLTFHANGIQFLQDYSGVYEPTDSGYFLTINRERRKIKQLNTYIYGHMAFYDYFKLKQLLQTIKPFIKNYPPFTPFDFELKRGKVWFLPVKFGLPKYEVFACIDDSKFGPSLQDRGLYPLDKVRTKMYNQAQTAPNQIPLEEVLSSAFYRFKEFKIVQKSPFLAKVLNSGIYRLRYLTKAYYSFVWFKYLFANRHLRLVNGRVVLSPMELLRQDSW